MRRVRWCGVACAASVALQACAAPMRPLTLPASGHPSAPATDGRARATLRLDAALAALGREAGRPIALDPMIDGARLVDVPPAPWPEALREVAREVDALVEPCGEVVFVIARPCELDLRWAEHTDEVVLGALVGHDAEALGLELEDGQLLIVRLPPPDDERLAELLGVLDTALEGDRVALRVRWGAGAEPTLEAFVGEEPAGSGARAGLW